MALVGDEVTGIRGYLVACSYICLQLKYKGMKKYITTLVFGLLVCVTYGQGGYVFGIKGGPTLAIQQWNAFERDPLLRYHGDIFIESLDDANQFTLFAQGGYHVKGSSIRFDFVPIGTGSIRRLTDNFQFRNISVVVGAKQKFDFGTSNKLFYSFGIRGDYTLSTKLRPTGVDETDPLAAFYPFDGFVNKFNYGISVGGGLEFPFSEFVGISLEGVISPDFSLQYNQPDIPNIIVPGGGGNRVISERRIRNIAIEVSLGLRLLRKIEYID